MHWNNMLKVCHTFEVVGSPDTSDHLGARCRSSLTLGEAQQKASGGAGLAEGWMAVGVLGAEAELEAGAGIGAPDLGDAGETAEGAGGAGGGRGVARVVHGEGLGCW